MAEAKLNFDENALDKTSGVYDLYSRLYAGMKTANQVDVPSFDKPPLTDKGEIDTVAINKSIAEYSDIISKNAAYLFANSIVTVVGGSGGGVVPGVGFVSRNGDTMAGNLGALYGFQAGYNNIVILESLIDKKTSKSWVNITGNLKVSENAKILGLLDLSESGISFNDVKTIFYDQAVLNIASDKMKLAGYIDVAGSIHLGKLLIDDTGICYDGKEFHHSGNSNNKDVDWSMKNGHVYGVLTVDKESILNGKIFSTNGFEFSLCDKQLLFTGIDVTLDEQQKEVKSPYISLASDLRIIGNHGIKIDGNYIVSVKEGTPKIVSFSAPDMVMYLGGEEKDKKTKYISLQTSIKNYDSSYDIITQYGDGNFPNSFSAGCGNAGPIVIRTFAKDSRYGIVVPRELRFGDSNGPALFGMNDSLAGTMPYKHMVYETEKTEYVPFSLSYVDTDSLFRDLSKSWSATLQISTDAEFFRFDKNVESSGFSVKSNKYKTLLTENTLLFDDGKFLEGVRDGIRHSGNSYFDNNLSSPTFSSGFAGSGWAIKKDAMAGGIAATFDEVTIRKKLRVFELEVQKNSVTNGSVWVSDACSGDTVEPIY